MMDARAATLTVSEPFDALPSVLAGVVVEEDDDGRLLFRLTTPVPTLAGIVEHMVISPRSSTGPESGSIEVSVIGLTEGPTDEPGWGAARWRGGGLAMIATLRWED